MTNSSSKLSDIHDQLCHPGVTRLLYFVRTKNLSYSTDDVKKLCHSCIICAELKPQFYCPQQNTHSKASKSMERWSIDFKGALRSSSQNTYMLTIVDEYSRFPFAFHCPNTTSAIPSRSASTICVYFVVYPAISTLTVGLHFCHRK